MNNNELMLDVGQADEIKLAMRREGFWTNEKIKNLCKKGFLAQVLEVLEGRAEIVPITKRWYVKDGVIYFTITSNG